MLKPDERDNARRRAGRCDRPAQRPRGETRRRVRPAFDAVRLRRSCRDSDAPRQTRVADVVRRSTIGRPQIGGGSRMKRRPGTRQAARPSARVSGRILVEVRLDVAAIFRSCAVLFVPLALMAMALVRPDALMTLRSAAGAASGRPCAATPSGMVADPSSRPRAGGHRGLRAPLMDVVVWAPGRDASRRVSSVPGA